MADLQDRICRAARECLWRWAPFAESYWWNSPDRRGLGCFGTGYNYWGVQTNQKYLGAMAVLAASKDEPEPPGFSRELALERALAALRFSLATHLTGDCLRTDGTQWGRTWITGLGIERMMHGVERLEPHLNDADRERLRIVLADEADYQLSVPVVAGLWAKDGRNKPESNIWNGAVCARAAMMYPGHPNAARWIEQAHVCFINGISVPADAADETVIAGRPVRERHAGANFFPHYALDHHSYLNVGYMVICLSNIAMLHYGFVLRGAEPPATLYHHAADLWALVRRLIFADGRLIRIGGDTRIRYCYCQDYLVPTLAFAADHWRDPHALELLERAVELARREQAVGGDGRFLCARLAPLERQSPYYYTRLEADKAAVLSMALEWLERRTPSPHAAGSDFESSVEGGWAEHEHGAVFHRCATRFASWSWRSAEIPQGLCLPPDDGDHAEWCENLAGGVHVLGDQGGRVLRDCSIQPFDGGFVTIGSVIDGARVHLPEGYTATDSVTHRIVFAALPDRHTVVRMELATLAPRRIYLDGWEGVKLEIPNDIFLNRSVRLYHSARGTVSLAPHVGPPEEVELESIWVNVDGVLGLVGIYGAESWTVLRRGRRIGGRATPNILTDALCYGLRTEPCDRFGPADVLDNACLIVSSIDAARTREIAEAGPRRLDLTAIGSEEQDSPTRPPAALNPAGRCRAVLVTGQDGCAYVLAANFGDADAVLTFNAGGADAGLRDLTAGACIDLASGDRLDRNVPLLLPAQYARLLTRS